MPSKVESALARIEATIAQYVSGTTFGFGAVAASSQRVPPCVVFERANDTVGPAPTAGVRPDPTRGRCIAALRAGLLAYIWGATDEQAEQLEHALVIALHDLVASAHPAGLAWEAPAGTWFKDGVVSLGQSLTFGFTLVVPIEKKPPTVGQATTQAFDSTGAADGDGTLTAGEG